jgi:four helix bundle protein
MALQNYRELVVWQRGIDLVEIVYNLTQAFPPEEKFGITSQLRRAAVSVVLNIAEGYGREHRGDYRRFLSIARGSLCEVETLLILAGRLNLLSREELNPAWQMSQRVGQLLNRLSASLAADAPPNKPPADA